MWRHKMVIIISVQSNSKAMLQSEYWPTLRRIKRTVNFNTVVIQHDINKYSFFIKPYGKTNIESISKKMTIASQRSERWRQF